VFREKGKKNKPITTVNIGCGYPSDPKTKEWLKDHLSKCCGLPEIVRFSWKTVDNLYKKMEFEVKFKKMYRYMTLKEFEATGCSFSKIAPKDYVTEGRRLRICVNLRKNQ
jgi:ribonuclease H2 subunit A